MRRPPNPRRAAWPAGFGWCGLALIGVVVQRTCLRLDVNTCSTQSGVEHRRVQYWEVEQRVERRSTGRHRRWWRIRARIRACPGDPHSVQTAGLWQNDFREGRYRRSSTRTRSTASPLGRLRSLGGAAGAANPERIVFPVAPKDVFSAEPRPAVEARAGIAFPATGEYHRARSRRRGEAR